MKLTVLGSGGAFAGGDRAGSSYLLESNGNYLLLDLGYGSFKNLEKVADFQKINQVLFTHFHPDHVADLVALLDYRNAAIEKRNGSNEQLNIIGPKGTMDFIEKLKALFPSFSKLPFKIKTEEMDYGKKKTFGFVVNSKPMKHVPNSIGYRIETGNKAIAYSGDTAYCQEIIDLARNADLLVLESSTQTQKTSLHLSALECGQIAQKAGAKFLVLSHLGFEPEEKMAAIAAKGFKGKILVAKDLLEVTL